MRRAVYTSSPCRCSMPGIAKALDEQIFGHIAQTLGKLKAPVPTKVGRYVNLRVTTLKRRLAKALRAQAVDVGAIVRLHWPHALKLAKAEGDDLTDDEKAVIVQSILDRLNGDDLGLGSDLTDALEGPMQAAFRTAASLGLTEVGFEEDRSIVEQLDEKALTYAKDRSAELVTDLADTTLEDLRGVIAKGVEDGMSTDELGDAIDEMGAFGESRAETIARTELAGAHVQGNVEGWRQTGEVEKKISVLGDLHAIDDECDDCADAGEVDLDDEFVPGYDFPPYHPNCICDVIPVLVADE